MALIVLQLPARERLRAAAPSSATAAEAGGTAAAAALGLPDEFDFVLSHDGLAVAQSGRAALADLPRSDRLVVVLADADVSWHRIAIPKAPQARLRAALGGAMEEALLEDDETLHLALGPGAAPGAVGDVAVTHRGWLRLVLTRLGSIGRVVDQVATAAAPVADGEAPRGYFYAPDSQTVPTLVMATGAGVAAARIDGALARALLPPEGTRVDWSAAPAAAAAAERWLGAPLRVVTDAERALEAARSRVNLLQFELTPRHRGLRALREGLRRVRGRPWRAARWALAAFVALNVVGLNAWAWQQQRTLQGLRTAMTEVLTTTHPNVRAVLDAPAQMQRETERLRASAGRAGDGDLEALLSAAAAVWPDNAGTPPSLRFETGRLVLASPGIGEPQLSAVRSRLQAAGYAVETSEGRITLSRAGAGGGAGSGARPGAAPRAGAPAPAAPPRAAGPVPMPPGVNPAVNSAVNPAAGAIR